MQKHISSLQNPLVKQWLQLQEKSRERKNKNLFMVEGKREIELALKGGYTFNTLIYCSDIVPLAKISAYAAATTEIVLVSKPVYEKLAYRQTTEGVLAVVQTKQHELSYLRFNDSNPLILVAEAPEKPGNIGALLRTADAAGVDAVIIANPKTDLYNPNIIRSSVGCLFTTQIASASSEEVIQFLKSNSISIFCAALQASKDYTSVNYSQSCAIVVGTEATGLESHWLEASTQNIIIPMHGIIDSMNVSVAAAVLIFEAKRQRKLS